MPKLIKINLFFCELLPYYSQNPNTGHVQYSNGQNMSDCLMVQYLIRDNWTSNKTTLDYKLVFHFITKSDSPIKATDRQTLSIQNIIQRPLQSYFLTFRYMYGRNQA